MHAVRVALIVNPVARAVARRPDLLEAVVAAWRRTGATVEVLPTTGPGSADELARQAAPDVEVIALLGGDGTLNAAANGLADAAKAVGDRRAVAALAALPGGSTNVFVRSAGLPRDPVAAATALAAAAQRGARVPVHAGTLDGRLFLANAGIGFDAAVVARADARIVAKRRLGAAWFAWCAASEALSPRGTSPARHHGPRLHLAGEPAATWSWVVALARTPYSYLGPAALDLEPREGPTGGHRALTVLGVDSMRRLTFLRTTTLAVRSTHGVIDGSRIARISASLPARFESNVPMPAQLDGDHVGVAKQFVVDHRADAFDRIDTATDTDTATG